MFLIKLSNTMQQAYDEINETFEQADQGTVTLSDEVYLLLEETRGFLAEAIELLSGTGTA
jgi:hypothetical protein